jgi:release factor glutamine methyltransferase
MTIQHWLTASQTRLVATGIPTARLDCLVLLEDCVQKDRAQLLAHPELILTPEQEKVLQNQLQRRIAHEPLAYIRGKSEFYGRDFIIDHRVLVPRPESETIIELLKALTLPDKCVIADLGTGSGMLAITAKLELPDCVATAVDIDKNCLLVAQQNAQKHMVTIELLEGNLVLPLAGRTINVILANLPYVPDDFHINNAAMHEPALAIFGGPDGLDLYRTLFNQIDSLDTKPAYIITESLPTQHEGLAKIALQHNYYQDAEDDFIQLFTL